MRCKRLLLLVLPALALGGALAGGLAACDDDTEARAPGAPPAPPAPPEPPPPPPPPDAPDALATDYFEVTDEGEGLLEADLDLALGRVETARAEDGYLFQAEVMLPQERLRPRFMLRRMRDASPHTGPGHGSTARVALALDEAALSPGGVRRGESARWRVYLPTRTPTALTLRLGAAHAALDLTGIPLRRLALDCGLSRADLRFTAPNPVAMEALDVEAGLADFRAAGLGHARFRRMRFDGGAGRFALDFTGGALTPGAVADVSVGMAELVLTLPRGQAIALEAPGGPFVSVDVPPSYVRAGAGWRSPEAAGVPDPFRLRVDAGPGRVAIRLAD